MALVANRRSVMTLFSSATDPESHRVRLVFAEKGITVEVVDVDGNNKPEDLTDLNPYNSVPMRWIGNWFSTIPAPSWNTSMSVSRIRR